MKNILTKPLAIFKNHRKKSIAGLVVLVLILLFVIRGDKTDTFTLNEAKVGSIVQEVGITGKIVSAQAVNLSFEQSGKVTYVGVQGGQRVRSGQILISIDASELAAQRQRALADVNSAQLRLGQVSANNDLNLTKLSLENEQKNLTQIRTKVSVDRAKSSLQAGVNAMVTLTDMQYKYFGNNSLPESIEIAAAKEATLKVIYNQDNLGRTGAWYFLPLKTGLYESLKQAESENPNFNYEKLLSDTRVALNFVSNSLSILSSRMSGVADAASADKLLVGSAIDTVNGQISAITSQEQAILSAQSAVAQAQTKLASNNTFDVGLAKTDLDRAQASLAQVNSQLAKYSVRAPFSGIAANIDVKVGQVVSTSTPAVSLIGDAKFQIETNISEADIAKVTVGDQASVTLDAYGKDQKFTAQVIHIDPAGRNAQDVVTYRVKLEFLNNDSRLLSGLTADVDILTDKKESALFVSSRDVISKDDKKFVKVAVREDSQPANHFANISISSTQNGYKVYEVPVQTGLRGSDGKTEIISGIKPGDMIVSD